MSQAVAMRAIETSLGSAHGATGPLIDSPTVSITRLAVLLCCLLLAPALAVAAAGPPDLEELLKGEGLTLADLQPGTRAPLDRGVGAAARWRLASVDALLASPLTFAPWAQTISIRLTRDLPLGGLPSWDGLFAMTDELDAGAWTDPCAGRAGPTLGLIDHHVAWETERDIKPSRREIKALREELSPALDLRIGGLVGQANLARCRLDAALAPLDEAGRDAVVAAIEALLAGLPPGTFEAQEALATLTGAWHAIDAAGLLAAGQAWSEAVTVVTSELAGLPEADWPLRPAIFSTRHGEVWIGSMGHNSGTGDPFAIVDPGGDDVWRIEPSRDALPRQGARAVRAWIDIGGDDLWQGGAASAGGALLSISAGVDVAGDDTWRLGDLSGGAAAFGVATWLDAGGADVRTVGVGGEGFATFGVAAARDRGRDDDVWQATDLAQGAALPLGIGVVHDEGGDDRFLLSGRDLDEPVHEDWVLGGGQGLSLGLHPLIGGGLGWLQDDGGDDALVGASQVQGGCSGGGIGVAWDRSGDDLRWSAGSRAQAAAGFLCVAGLFDDSGNDVYIGDNHAQAFAWERSVAMLWDGLGADRYEVVGQGQAWSGPHALAMLVDAAGGDRYTASTTSQGWTTSREQLGIALLLDWNGRDSRVIVEDHRPPVGIADPPELPPMSAETALERLRAGTSGVSAPFETARDLADLGLEGLAVVLPTLTEDRPAEIEVVQRTVWTMRHDLDDDGARALAELLAADALERERSQADATAQWHLIWLKELTHRHAAAVAEPALRAVDALVDHPAWPVRRAALEVYGSLVASELEIDPIDLQEWEARAAIALQSEAHPEARQAALSGLSLYGGPGVAGLLAEALAREARPNRGLAARALAQMATRTDGVAIARAVFPLVGEHAEVTLPVRSAALRLLGLTGHREAWDVLEPALSDVEPRIRAAAAVGARYLGGRAVERALAERLEVESDPAVREALAGGGVGGR
jgi:hypothetical protein